MTTGTEVAKPIEFPHWSDVPDESHHSPARAGWVIVMAFFGLFGGWALMAPLNGAVVADAFVKVEGNRKSIQHLDGGIVRELRVREGETVKAGDVLLTLDDSQARAEFEVYAKQFIVLRATEARLRSEFIDARAPEMPTDLLERKQDPDVRGAWRAQLQQFEARRRALEGQRQLVGDRIAQLDAQVTGGEAQMKALTAQLASIRAERETLEPLVKKGLVTKPRVLQLDRSASGIEAQIADIQGQIARARQGIAEQRQQGMQLGTEQRAEIATELRDTQAKLLEVVPRLTNAQAVLGRTIVRSPYAGTVVGLSVFSVGGVIGRGERIMDVVPESETLVVEARVKVEEISDVHPDMEADVHLIPFKQRTVPVVKGKVTQISADRLTDQKSGMPYYVAQVAVDESELKALPHVRLYPGMPVTVIVPTLHRTAFTYLVGPLMMSFNEAFRQK